MSNFDFRTKEPEYEEIWGSYQERVKSQREYFEQSLEIQPLPGFCFKTQIHFGEGDWFPVFINICSHFRIPEPRVETIAGEEGPVERYRVPCSCSKRYDFEYEGEKACYFIVVFHTEQVKECLQNEEKMGFAANIAAEKLCKKEKAKIRNENVDFCAKSFIGSQQKPDPQRIMKAKNLIQEEGKISEVPTINEKSNAGEDVMKETRSKRVVQPVLSVVLEDGSESSWDREKESLITHLVLRLCLPLCKNANSIEIDLEDNTLVLQETEHGYECKFTFPLEVKQEDIDAKFLKKTQTLQLMFEVESRTFEFWRNALKLDEDALLALIDIPPVLNAYELTEIS